LNSCGRAARSAAPPRRCIMRGIASTSATKRVRRAGVRPSSAARCSGRGRCDSCLVCTVRRSRESSDLRGLPNFSPRNARERSADRRLGWIAAPSRASDAGPQGEIARPRVPTQTSSRSPRIRGTLASRRSTAAVFGPAPVSVRLSSGAQRGGALKSHVVHSRVPLVVAGDGVAGRLPGVGYQPTRRTPVPLCSMPSRRAPLTGGTTRRCHKN
jgi:hypothetical protein